MNNWVIAAIALGSISVGFVLGAVTSTIGSEARMKELGKNFSNAYSMLEHMYHEDAKWFLDQSEDSIVAEYLAKKKLDAEFFTVMSESRADDDEA